MKAKENFGSRFLYSEDLLVGGEFKTVELTISEYHEPGSMKSADGRVIDKPSIGFEGKQKLLVLCKTNSSVIHFATGEPPGAKWIGHRITLQPRMVEAFGDTVVALRVMPPQGCKIRKSILQRLGAKATWAKPANGKPQSTAEPSEQHIPEEWK